MKLSTRLTLGIVGAVVLTAVLAGFLAYRGFRSTMISEGMVQLVSRASQVADQLADHVAGARADVLTLRQSPLIEALVRADRNNGTDPVTGRQVEEIRNDLAGVFFAHMRNKPAYLQIRLIGLKDGGREIVRVDRENVSQPPRRVVEENLQRKGDRPYFLKTIPLADGQVFVSPVQLNQERGVIQRPFVPVLRTATPVTTTDGHPFGVVIINVGMRPVFEDIRRAMGAVGTTYITDTAGNFILHPDSSLEFGAEFGMPGEAGRRMPSLQALFDVDSVALIKDLALTEGHSALALFPQRLAGGPKILVMQSVAHHALLAFATPLRDASLFAAMLAILLSAGAALYLGKRLARPIVAITNAARTFNGSNPISTGVTDSGEIGDLASAIEQMTTQVCSSTNALNHEVKERGRLEERFRLVVESSPSGMIMVNHRGDITLVNAEAERMFGYSRGTLLGQSVDLLLPGRFRAGHPMSRAHFHANPEQRVMGAGRELFGLRRDGSEFPVEIGLTPIETDEGLQVLSVIIDITSRKQAEDRFQLAVEACPGGMIMVDEKGTMTLVNAEAERLFGYPRVEMIGKPVEMLLPDRLRGGHPGFRAQFHAKPEKRTMGAGRELFARRRDGSEFPVEIGLTPIRTKDGVFVLSVIIDITSRKEAEQAARRYTEILERTNRDLEEFTSIASHDLQEPLRKITSFGDRLLTEYSSRLDPTGQGYLDRLVNSADRMRKLVTSLLEYSRSGRMKERPVEVDLNRTVQEVIADLESPIAETSATVHAAQLPVIEANPVQMRQLFQNLIGNALKFHKPGQPPEVSIHAGPEPDHRVGEPSRCRILVEDRGIGFEQAYAERIFIPFERLHGQGEYEGTGMGLAICRRIVEKHGGSLSADGVSGAGARFTIILPIKQPNQGGSSESEPANHRSYGG